MKFYSICTGVFFLILVGFIQARAQSDNTFVSTTGVDTAMCGARTLPCRTFAAALTNTNAGGVVMALDTGVYPGSISIDKSVTLSASPGARAELTAVGSGQTDLITINAATSAVVNLQNLYLTGNQLLVDGIFARRIGSLNIEKCTIRGFSRDGILVLHDSSNTTEYAASITDTTVSHCGVMGIEIEPSESALPLPTKTVKASINHCRTEFNGLNGISVGIRAKATIRDTVAANNNIGGFVTGTFAEMNVENSEAFNEDIGIGVELGSKAIISDSIVTNNRVGIQANYTFAGDAAVVYSLGNNLVRSNGSNIVGPITVVSGN